MDGKPHDNVISRHELFPVRAPLTTLEHCIGDFLDKCDQNHDHGISQKVSFLKKILKMPNFIIVWLSISNIFFLLQEWAICLEIDDSDIEAKCEAL